MLFSDEELALIDAIHADPRGDAPRLAYAQWCEKNDLSNLAEFIRIQCREPYFILSPRGGIHVETDSYQIQFEDPERAARSIELLGKLLPSDRFPKNIYWDEYERGLPVYEEEYDRYALENSMAELNLPKTPFGRYRIYLETPDIAQCLRHPIMRFVDVLRLRNDADPDTGEWRLYTESDIRALIESPITSRLKELNLGVHFTNEAERLAREELEMRVRVTYDY